MSEMRPASFLRRVAREHRVLVWPILGLLVLNVAVYAAFVYPMSRRVSSVTQRTQAAEADLTAARLAHTRVSNALSGKSLAAKDLETFYRKVLPVDQSHARRLMFPRIPNLANEVGVATETANVEFVNKSKDDTLSELKVKMQLTGRYGEIRDLVSRIERAPEFIVINSVALQGEGTESEDLVVQLDVSTFFEGSAQ